MKLLQSSQNPLQKSVINYATAVILLIFLSFCSTAYAQTPFNVTGGGAYCLGGSGVNIGLSSSDVGIDYQLKNGNSNVGSPVAGTGSAISFGNQTASGTYTVQATNTNTLSTNTMTGTAVVTVNPLPSISLTASVACLGGTLTVNGTGLGDQLVWKHNGSTIQSGNAGWNEYGNIIGQDQANEPMGVFVANDGYIYVTDVTNAIVLKFPPNATSNTTGEVVAGDLVNGIGSDSSQLDYPTAVVVDDSGYIYVCDYYNNRIQKFPPNSTGGTKAVTVAANDLDGPFDIALDGSGNLYVVDQNNGRVLEFTSGSDENTTGTEVANGFSYPMAVALDASGNIYVSDYSDHDVKKFPGGATVAGGNGNGSNSDQLESPADIYVDNSGYIFVLDQGNNRIQMFPPNSTSDSNALTVAALGGWGSNTNQIDYAFGMTVDAGGNIYVADYGNSRILRFNINNTYTPSSDGMYTITVTNLNGCSASDTVVMEDAPIVYNVTGGGSYCSGGTGLPIGLSQSETGVNYQLKRNGSNVGSAIAGTGSALNFGNQTSAGTYTVTATTAVSGCENTMSGSALVNTVATPVASIVTESICPGRVLTLSSNQSWLSKITWKKDGVSVDSFLARIDTTGVTVATSQGPVAVYVDNDTVYTIGWLGSNIRKWAPGAGTGTIAAGNNNLTFSIGMTKDASGNFYVSDYFNDKVTKWLPGAVVGTIVAGGNGTGSAPNQVNSPAGVFVDNAGNVYVADRNNNRIQKWTTGASSGITVAGGNGSGAAANQLKNPFGVFVDGNGNIYVADSGNNRIQKWAPGASSGITVAGGNGSGAAANQLKNPTGIYVDGNNTMYIADFGNHRIQKWEAGAIFGITIAGGNGTGATSTKLNNPISVWMDKGNIYAADLNNNRIQKFAARIDSVLNTAQGGGTYIAEVNSTSGCSVTTLPIVVPSMPWATAMTTPALCYGGSTGTADLTVNGGTPPFTYAWSNGATTEDLNNVSAGTYNVIATDNTGCTASASATVSQPSQISITKTRTNISCFSGNNGGINLTAAGGTAPYTYSWSNGATTQNVSGLTAGIYIAVVTDANGCTKNDTTVITEPDILVVTATPVPVSCYGGSNGAINLTVLNGTPPYWYNWSNGYSTQTISNLKAGTYSVTVTDANGCSANEQVILTQSPNALTYNVTITNPSCSAPSSGAIEVSSVTGGFSPYQYKIGTSGSYGTNNVFTGLSANLYKVTVVDSLNCAITKEVGVIMPFCSVAKNDSIIACINTPINIPLSQLLSNDTIAPGETVSIGDWTDPATGTLAYNDATKTFTYTPAANYAGPVTFTYTIKKNDSTFFWGGTNHFYEFRSTSVNWSSARALAGSFVKNGMKGYLATITTAAENEFVRTRLQGDGWIGASDLAYEGQWRWVTGPEGLEDGGKGRYFVTQNKIGTCSANTGTTVGGFYHNWQINEPNDCGITIPSIYSPTDVNRFGEHAAYYLSSDIGKWNDNPPAILHNGYVIEYGGLEDATLPVIGSTATIYINVDAPLVFNVTGGGQYCAGGAGLAIGLSSTETGVNYQLKNGSVNIGAPLAGTGSAISFGNQTLAGTYTVVATKVSTGCNVLMNGNATIIINPLPIVFNITGGGNYCSGGNGVSIGLGNSETGVSYQLKIGNTNMGSPIAGTGSAINFGLQTTPGTYTVTATSLVGCIQNMSGNAVISINPLPVPSTAVSNVSCFGSTNGSINLTVNSGSAPYTYNWSNNATTEDVNGLSPGTYSVMITDANGCIANTSAIVTEPAALLITGTASNGIGGGAIDITVSGGTAPYSYNWNNNATTEDVSGLIPGTYSVIVTDDNGCTVSDTFTNPLFIDGIITHVSCNGSSNGAIDVIINGGVPPYTYLWTNGSTTEDRTGLAAGIYSILITDGNGDTISNSWTVTQPPVLAISGTVVNADCGNPNGSINLTVSGGSLSYSYLWNDNTTTEDRTNLSPGIYTVSVTDANGCSRADTFIITQPAPLVITGSVTNVSAFGGSNGAVNISVTGCEPPYTYSWSNSATTEDITGIIAGTYIVIVTDANGATATDTFVVNQPAALAISGIVTNVTTFGGNNGSINITVTGGVGPYTYIWSNSTTAEDPTGLIAGSYTVTVTDANGATRTATFVVTQPSNSTFPIVSTCTYPYIVTLESVTLVSGNYEWVWSVRNPNPGNGYNGTVQNLSHWNITLGSCASFSSIVSGATSTNGTNWSSFTPTYQGDASMANTCNVNTGNVVKFNLGTSGSNKSYYKLVTTQNLPVNMQAVAYYKSGNRTGCGTVCFPGFGCQFSVSTSHTNVTCYGTNNGSINLIPTGGTSPYSYSWSNGASTEDLTGLGAGTYIVTVTDGNGQVRKDTTIITAPTSALSVSGIKTNIKCKGADDGKVDVSVSGGNGPYTYSWSNGSSNNNNSNWWNWWSWWCGNNNNNNTYATTQDVSGLEPGTYTVTVTDANGCQKTASFTITEPSSAVEINGNVTNVSCGSNCNGAINITATGGTAPYSYKWNNNATAEDRTGLCAGSYSVVVTDANGCTANKSFTVGQGQSNMNVSIAVNPSPTVSGQAQNTIFQGYGPQSVTLTANPTNGSGTYSYSWYPTSGLSSSTSKTPTASPSSTKTYTVTVTDGSGCTKSQSVTINVKDVEANGNKIYVCKNGSTKKVSVSQVASYLNNGYTLGKCDDDDDDDDCDNKGVMETVEVKELKLYPNPTTGVFAIDLPEAVKGGVAMILDASGKLIQKVQFLPDTKLSFDMSYAPNGTYMIQISNGADVYKARVTIQR